MECLPEEDEEKKNNYVILVTCRHPWSIFTGSNDNWQIVWRSFSALYKYHHTNCLFHQITEVTLLCWSEDVVWLYFMSSTSLITKNTVHSHFPFHRLMFVGTGEIDFWPTFSTCTDICLPVIESQRFLFISWRQFVLKEEDLDQNHLENHQTDHQTNGQTERHKRKIGLIRFLTLLFVCHLTAAMTKKSGLHNNSQVGEHAQSFPMQHRKNQHVGHHQGKQKMDTMDSYVA